MNSLRLAFLLAATAPLCAQTTDLEHLRVNVLQQMAWRELGPVAFGGRIVDIEVHPTNPSIYWVASASGGLFRTDNRGLTFTPQFQDAYSISIGDIAVAPSNPDVLYVGTGESNNQRSSYWGDGVHRSGDGGKTWAHVGLTGTEHIGRIVVHPTNPDIVLVAALGALYSSNDERGLYRTQDGGKTWQRTLFVSENVGVVDVALDPTNPDIVFAASYERRRRAFDFDEGGPGSRLHKSKDGGLTFTQLRGGLPEGELGRIGVVVAAKDPKVLYATIENLNPDVAPPEPEAKPEGGSDASAKDAWPDAETQADPLAFAEWQAARADAQAEPTQDPQESKRAPRRKTMGGEVWRSDDAGESWTKPHKGRVGGEPLYYYGQIRVDPSDANVVYVLGVPVFRSTDAGKTWTPANERAGRRNAYHGNLHVDHHALWIDPKDGQHALLGNDGGLAETFDAGAHWDHVARLPIAQFYTVAVDPSFPYRVYGGLQDNGTWGFPAQTPGGIQAETAFRIDGGDGFCVAIDPTDADVVYSESQFGGMSRQNLRTGERAGIRPKAEKGQQPLRFNWMSPLVLSPHAPRTVYVGSQFVHCSRDRGATWTTISPDLTTNDADKKLGDVPHCTITMIAESPRKAGLLWVGTDDGNVHRSRDGGQSWIDLTARFPAATRGLWVSRIEASPHAADTVFVALTGFREDRREPLLFRSDDCGESFLPIANDLPQEPINVVRQHPENPSLLLVGTEMGMYASLDDGGHWAPLGKGLPRSAVHDLVIHPVHGHVIAATHGRGMWVLDGKGLGALTQPAMQKEFVALPPSDGVVMRRTFSRGFEGARKWSVESPFATATFRFYCANDRTEKVVVEVIDAADSSLFRTEVDAKAGYHEVAWAIARGPGGVRGFLQGVSGSRRNPGQRVGQFAVRITCGKDSATLPFAVHDLRGPRDALGPVPGIGARPEVEDASDDHEGDGDR